MAASGSYLVAAMKYLVAVPIFVFFVSLACTSPERKPLNLYPSPSSEARVRVITTTPLPTLPTSTPIVVVQTTTPVPPKPVSATKNEINWLCVTAQEAVYLRPSPSTENYPITQLDNGQKVKLEGGADGLWLFVTVGDQRGWVNRKYLSACK